MGALVPAVSPVRGPMAIRLSLAHVLNGAFYSLPYDLLNDFAPVSPLGTGSLVLSARKNMPAENLNELIAWLRGNPNRASAGFGGGDSHLATAFFQKVTGTQFVLVPYRGGGPAIQDLVAGQIDLYFAGSVFIPLVRAGSIKAYAVTSDTRLALAPDIPTFAEMGLPALSFSSWIGLFAPPTPKVLHRNKPEATSYIDPHVQRPHAVGAHVAQCHGRPGLGSWSIAHAGEDIRASSATASSGRCALLRDTVPDQGEGRSAAGTGEGEPRSPPTGASCCPRRAATLHRRHQIDLDSVSALATGVRRAQIKTKLR
jgi:hypothetical protein